MEWSHKGEVRMEICKVISLWNLISNEWFFMWNKWLVLKKKGKRKEKRCDHHNFKLQRECKWKKKSEESFICNQKKGMHVIRWKKRGSLFYFTQTTLSVISDCHQAITSHTTNINRYIDKEAEEELTAIIPLVNTTTVSLWTAGVLLRPYLTLPDLIRDQPDIDWDTMYISLQAYSF